jgi:hypothetical protein
MENNFDCEVTLDFGSKTGTQIDPIKVPLGGEVFVQIKKPLQIFINFKVLVTFSTKNFQNILL